MIIKKSFPDFLIQNLMMDKFEKSFWGKKYMGFPVLSTLCSMFYEYCALLGVMYKTEWKTFIIAFNAPLGEEEKILTASKSHLENNLLPFYRDCTFHELFSKKFGKLTSEKFDPENAIKLAALYSLEGAIAGITHPEIIRTVYYNGEATFKMIDQINSDFKNLNVKERLELSDYTFPSFENRQFDINTMFFLNYAEENLSNDVYLDLLLVSRDFSVREFGEDY